MSLHKQLTNVVMRWGPDHPFVRVWLSRRSKQYGCELFYRPQVLELRKGNRVILFSRPRFIHIPDIARRFDTYFEPLVPTPTNDGLSVIDYSKPGLQTYKRSGLQFEMPSWPEEEEAIEAYFRWYQPKAGDLVFDLGAHCGVSAYYFSKLVGPTGSVVAFEPDPLNYSILLRNIKRHGMENITPVKAAVARVSGSAPFQADGTIGSSLAGCSNQKTVKNFEMVETLTFTDAYRQWGVPDFCKLDIEGAEIEVLESSKDLLRSHPGTHFALDTTHIVDGKRTDQQVEDIFRECGFEVTTDRASGTTWAGPKTAVS